MRLLTLCAAVCRAYDVSGRLVLSNVPLSDRLSLLSSSKIVARSLSSDPSTSYAYPLADGTFKIRDLADDSPYLLRVDNAQFAFSEIVVFMGDTGIQSTPYDPLGKLSVAPSTEVKISVIGGISYYPEKQAFDAFQFLKNPMVLFSLVAMGLMTFMTKMQANLDPADQVGRAADNAVHMERFMQSFTECLPEKIIVSDRQ